MDKPSRRSGCMAGAVGATAATASQQAGASAVFGKTEALGAFLVSLSFAKSADGTLPPEQMIYAWSVCGTVAGAALAGLHMKQGGWIQRVTRTVICCIGGLLVAPWAIAALPRSASTPEWWHAFGASGIAAAVAWIVVDEAGPLVREAIQDWRKRRRT